MLFNELENSFENENNTQEAGESGVPAQKEENTGKIPVVKEPKFDGSIHLAHNM